MADASASSSTTCIVPKDMTLPDAVDDRAYLTEHNERGEAQEPRRQPRGPHRGSCLRDSSMTRRHPPRFTVQRPAKSRKMAASSTVRDVDGSSCEGDDQLELHLSDTFPANQVADPRAMSPRRTFGKQRLRSRARRTTCAEVACDERDEGSFKAMHCLGFQDEQARSVKDKHQVVVIVEVHEPRNLGEPPNSSPIPPPWTRDLPQPEFMKDLQRNHSLGARLSDSLCSTTGSLASAEVLYVDGAAVHCDAAQVTPGEAAPKKVPTSSKTFQSDDDKPPNTARVQDFKNPKKISSTSMRCSSSHSSITDEKLDTATIDSSSKAASRTDSGIAVMTADVAKTSSGVASTCVMPYGKIRSFVHEYEGGHRPTVTIHPERAAGALLVFSDSDEGSIPPSGSMSLSFVSSNSISDPVYRVADLADLPRLQNNVAAANNETGDGSVVLRLPLPRLTSSATQTESSRQPASSLTERGTQAQELPERPCRSGWPLLSKARRSAIRPLGTTDRPWTEDIRDVIMHGNKNYLHQHARQRHLAKSATTLTRRCACSSSWLTKCSPMLRRLRWLPRSFGARACAANLLGKAANRRKSSVGTPFHQ
ncbi:hypothetical protein HPB50_005541 [Hyalomma asiaticum]|uniref:Uncharacterized protein n=1 Tax=Hyalomma asiaticum TaxID=266040 RepID=A0ACB7S0D8_HYAAI|nr:hypothetical protein HPB50_005541 [Hyalomma asiaticum]